jgi:diguanylate cyclase (GGDEF)-like protein
MQTQLQEMKRELLNCSSFVEMAECLPKSLSMVGYDELYILLNRDLYEMLDREEDPEYRMDGYPDDMKVLLAAIPNCILGGLKRGPGKLIPGAEDTTGGNTYLFSPLHLREREIGYTILKNCDHLMDSSMLYEVLNVFLETVQNMYNRMVLARMNDKLSRLYIRDSLTGLYNRMAYNQFAVPIFEQCMQKGTPLLVMFWDLDRLKYINDNFGHDMGNTAIIAITDSIQDCCPSDAIAMRYGGDEFIVLEAGYEREQAEKLIAAIEKEIDEKGAALATPFEIRASVGYVIASDPTKSLNDYINLADEGMYRNKKARKALEAREAIA